MDDPFATPFNAINVVSGSSSNAEKIKEQKTAVSKLKNKKVPAHQTAVKISKPVTNVPGYSTRKDRSSISAFDDAFSQKNKIVRSSNHKTPPSKSKEKILKSKVMPSSERNVAAKISPKDNGMVFAKKSKDMNANKDESSTGKVLKISLIHFYFFT